MEKNDRPALVAVSILFWALRALVLVQVQGTPLSHLERWSEGDMAYYHATAQRVAGGDLLLRDPPRPWHRWMAAMGTPEDWERWVGNRQTYFMEPGYPYLLGAVLALGGDRPWVWILFHQILSYLTLLMVFFLARSAGGTTAGLAAGGLFALYGPLMMYETVTLREPALVFALTAAVWGSVRSRSPFAVGLAAGWCVAAKAITVLMLPFLVLAWASRKEGPRTMVALAAGTALIPALFLARNLTVGAPPLALSTRGPVALYVGAAHPNSGVLADSSGMEDRGLRFRTIVERDGYTARAALWGAVASHPSPASFALLLVKKIYYLFHRFEAWNNVNWYFFRGLVFPMEALPGFLAVLLLALPGVRHLSAPRSLAWTSAGVLATVLAHPFLTSTLARYRQPLVPLLCVAAGRGLVWLLDQGKAGKRGSVAGWAAGALAVGFLLSVTAPPKYREADFGIYASILQADPSLRPHPGLERLRRAWDHQEKRNAPR
jgi:4-amino-4-deoxy-L-arabinose transferase-like glycosyltransferase